MSRIVAAPSQGKQVNKQANKQVCGKLRWRLDRDAPCGRLLSFKTHLGCSVLISRAWGIKEGIPHKVPCIVGDSMGIMY